jgi:ubiquinone/menaquinone biosynthesis C-methylase UbiE
MAEMNRILEPEYMDTPDESSEYDAMDHTEVNAAFVERLHELGVHGNVIDLGTGPGQIAIAIAESAEDLHVLGIDAAATMLTIAEKRKAASTAAQRIEFRQGNAKHLDLDDHSFDAVVSNTVLHHIPDPVEFLREAGRLLKPGGVLLIRDLFRPETPEDVAAIVNKHGEGQSALSLQLFRASLHAALTQEELRAAALEAGLEAFEITQDSDRHMSLQK